MKNVLITTALLVIAMAGFAQLKRSPAAKGRAEFIEVEKNVKLHVTDLGEGRPIVLIHGWPLSNDMYEYQYHYLVQKGYRVIGITLRGFGKSDKPYGKYDLDVFADDIKTVLEKLAINDAVLGGFSMGGTVVTRYAARHKAAHISKLALFGAAGPSWKKRPDFPYGVSDEDAAALIHLSMTNRPQLLENFGKAFGAAANSIPAGLTKLLENINMEASPYAATQSLLALREADLRPELSTITIPVAIFHGVHDKLNEFAFAEQFRKGLKNSFIVRFEKSGHGLFIEELDKFNTELEQFAGK